MKIKPIIIVGTNLQGQLMVSGDLKNKKMLLNVLAEGIKLVANHEEKLITTPDLKIIGGFKRGN